MANYRTILRIHPELRDFIGQKRWVYRGDILGYAADMRCNAYSTDAAGFRHSMLDGKSLSLADCMRSERYGLVLGASNVFGFGVAGNENTIAGILSETFGFPFANLGMPGGNSRNLYCLLLSILAKRANRPSVVVHFNGGDFAAFCEASLADPVFGSPNRLQIEAALEGWEGDPDPEAQLPVFLEFTSMWTTAIGNLCRSNGVRFAMGQDTSFFEKNSPSPFEIQSELGAPWDKAQRRHFGNHMRFRAAFYARRQAAAERLRVPLAGDGLADELTFVDEFHFDLAGTRLIAEAVAKEIEPLLVETAAVA